MHKGADRKLTAVHDPVAFIQEVTLDTSNIVF